MNPQYLWGWRSHPKIWGTSRYTLAFIFGEDNVNKFEQL
jgi:hypothetical protein